MGTTTPNIGIYIPSAGETNYDQSFLAGMMNVDQHDHSGATNKGVQIATTALADGSVTYPKLANNITDTSTGIGQQGGGFSNRLEILGILKNLYQLATASGFIAKNGSVVEARVLQGTANQIAISNPAGIAGDPTFSLVNPLYIGGISFDSGTNILGSYTKSSFTPALAFGGGSTGLTYTTQVGKYWRVGSIIFFSLFIKINAVGSSTGDATITLTGLPNSENNPDMEFSISTQMFANSYPGPAGTYATGELDPNTNVINVVGVGVNTQGKFTHANFVSGNEITMSGFYWVD